MKNVLLKRGSLNWLLKEHSVVVFDRIQATIYHDYWSLSERNLNKMKNLLLSSSEGDYSSWSEAISLALKCRLTGFGTRIPKSIDNGNTSAIIES